VSQEGELETQEARGRWEDLQEVGDPPQPEGLPEPEPREEAEFHQAKRQALSRERNMLGMTGLSGDEDRRERSVAEDAPED
jgi:hypothetical protein